MLLLQSKLDNFRSSKTSTAEFHLYEVKLLKPFFPPVLLKEFLTNDLQFSRQGQSKDSRFIFH